MSRKTNGELYVPYKKDTPELSGYEKLAQNIGAPPIKKLLLSSLCTLIASVIIIAVLMLTGLSLQVTEGADGVSIRYFGWISGGTPTLGFMQRSNGESASVSGASIVYSDGSVYTGTMNGLLREGEGRLIFLDGTTYTGQFKNDLFDGFGKLIYPDGTNYEGQFKEGSYFGFGILTMSNGTSYSGAFENGEPHGNGIMKYFDGSKFEGTFLRGMRDMGTYTWKSGESISGIFSNNIPSPDEYISYEDADGGTYYVKILDGVIVERISYIPDIDDTENEEQKSDGSDSEVVG